MHCLKNVKLQVILAPALGLSSWRFDTPVLMHFRISILCRVVVFKDDDIAPCIAIRDTSDAVYGTYLKTVEMTSRFDVLLTVHLSIFILVINQLDAQNFCFTISFVHQVG